MSSEFKSRDSHLAWELHNQINRLDVTGITENAAFPDSNLKENYKPKTLIDNTLEIIDPTPNIHTLFVQFDKRFFGNKLLPVEVKWSHRMTSCAGTCSFNTGSRYCVIALSSPLLKLRPRKDLIETLLHEMIHAYLFITNNNRDRDGHGPEFCKHMHRINKEAGTRITIYHSFHAEVKLYQQHWWRCNGPCQGKKPFFGMVRRSMNRAPGPNDFWFKEHQLTCGGQFIKVREPEKPEKGKKIKNDPKKDPKKSGIDKWLTPSPKSKPKDKPSNGLSKPKTKPGLNGLNKPKNKHAPNNNNINKPGSSSNINKPGGSVLRTKGGSKVITVNKWNTNTSDEPGIQKLGNATNNVHGFGTGGPGSSTSVTSKGSSGNHFSFSGTVGGSSTGQSKLLDLFSQPNTKPQSQLNDKKNQVLGPTVKCPICKDLITEKKANEHIDACLIEEEEKKKTSIISPTLKSTPGLVNCPVCSKYISSTLIIDHIDLCLTLQDKAKSSSVPEEFNSPSTATTSSPPLISIDASPQSPIVIHDSDSDIEAPNKKRKSNGLVDFFFKVPKVAKTEDVIANCPVCVKEVNVKDMNRHLDDCLAGFGEDVDTQEAGTSKERDSNEINPNGKGEPETCLICNAVLEPSVSLVQHLDDCLKNMFNDDTESFESRSFIGDKTSNPKEAEPDNSILSVEDSFKDESQEENELSDLSELGEIADSVETSNRSPCPVCMSMIPEKIMTLHLDACLGE
ncbi:sprT-like domain-containing protein Spartan [Belonocnema kinseyi]|uniref:sprT-like domain-containing protein Spartan n=1 Tax=Belonocnema kinseyi TaxID=2817044 RepID=UPI00143D5A71|nr:sprT-like domain-containing protein Spartan [Belonocnema kinseyi]